MKIFLGGGKTPTELYGAFTRSMDLEKPLLYIPIAMNKEDYLESLDYTSQIFNPKGIEKIIMWTENELESAKYGEFNQFGGIYVPGGNTFKLLRNFRKFGTMNVLHDLATSGIPYCGNSAGAVIACKTVIAAIATDEELEVRTEDIATLNLVSDCDLFPHYNEHQDKRITHHMAKYNLRRILAIPENSGLMYDGKELTSYGAGPFHFFENGQKQEFKKLIL